MFNELKDICAATLDLYATFRFHFELRLKKKMWWTNRREGRQRDGCVKERIGPSVCGFIWLDGENFICKFTEGFIVCCKQNR